MEFPLKSEKCLLHQFLSALILFRLLNFLASFVLKRNPKPNADKRPDEVKVLFFQFRKRITPIFFFSFLCTIWFVWTAYTSYCRDGKTFGYTHSLLESVLGKERNVTTNATSIFLAYILYFVHVTRRLNESLRISVFSHRQVISVLGVIFQYTVSLAVAISILANGPSLEETLDGPCFQLQGITLEKLFPIVMFVIASVIQHRTIKGFVKLRKNKAGHIVTTSYKLPKGGFFDYVSCPHFLAEAVIYISIGLVLRSPVWWLVVLGVIIREFDSAWRCHQFYKSKFAEDMPAGRKAFIPFLL